ncbi:type II toxin-antitoxin system RelE/ParE family toxin [Radicibacter daui]|uniref:type II toxin-antitoxin system RelE/ParE family toxin n=1 Tax=Radicibacter daui TaxID=3064829 RepID=UPI004046AE23
MATERRRLVRRESYVRDLEQIADHIAADNPKAALDIWDQIERQAERLREFPLSGRVGRIAGTRELVVAGTPFIVVYRVVEAIDLVRILHGAQQWP